MAPAANADLLVKPDDVSRFVWVPLRGDVFLGILVKAADTGHAESLLAAVYRTEPDHGDLEDVCWGVVVQRGGTTYDDPQVFASLEQAKRRAIAAIAGAQSALTPILW